MPGRADTWPLVPRLGASGRQEVPCRDAEGVRDEEDLDVARGADSVLVPLDGAALEATPVGEVVLGVAALSSERGDSVP